MPRPPTVTRRSFCRHVSSRPRWEAWFLPGLAQGRLGLFLRMHHAMADGVAGVAANHAAPHLPGRSSSLQT